MQRVPGPPRPRLTPTAPAAGSLNRNFLVPLRRTRLIRWVIRLAGNDTHLLGISREVEHAATVAAAGVGVGPEVTAFIRPEGYLVTRFIEGSAVSRRGRPPARYARSASRRSLRRVHDGPPIPGLFIPYRIVEAYRALGAGPGRPRSRPSTSCALASDAPDRARPAGRTRSSCDRATTICSNANFIDDWTRIRIVDWEYAWTGDPPSTSATSESTTSWRPTRTRRCSRRTRAARNRL